MNRDQGAIQEKKWESKSAMLPWDITLSIQEERKTGKTAT
jgi:hypothetical protein